MMAVVHVVGDDPDLLDGVEPEVAGDGAGGADPARIRPDLALLPIWSDVRPLQGMVGFLDWAWAGHLSALLRTGYCSGRAGERVLMPGGPGRLADRLVLVGLGELAALGDGHAWPEAQGLVPLARELGAGDVLLALPGAGWAPEADARLLRSVVAGLGGPRPGDGGAAGEAEPAEGGTSSAVSWWVSVAPDRVGRMRRMIGGPLRPAPAG